MAADRSADKSHRRFRFNSRSQALAHFDRKHKLILLAGGVGSGKTVLHGLDALERSKTETEVLHAIFTNTQTQLDKEVIPSIQERFEAAGLERPVFDRKPPISWIRRWVRDGIEIPPLARYRGILTAPTGYHSVCGTLFNQSYRQYETLALGTARIEEAINVSMEAVNTIFERVRCRTGGGEHCRLRHHHQRYLIFNPPRGPHPWLYSYLDQLEEGARSFYHAMPESSGDVNSADVCTCGRVHGPELNHRQWPLLLRGVGSAVLYQSRTSDNAQHLDDGYREGLAANMSKDSARRRLDGDIVRESEGGAYTEFSSENLRAVQYDPDRPLFICLDFNLEPRAAVFAQQLIADEYPSDHHRADVSHVGVFGEFFYAGEMSDRRFAEALVRGDRGAGLDSQPRYSSEELRGLPPSCDAACAAPCRKGHWNGLKAHRGRIMAFGDQRGTHRSSHGDNLESSWQIVDQVFRQLDEYCKNVPETQPSPRARVDSVNGKLCSSLGNRSLWVHPRCEELIRDFEQVMWNAEGDAIREWRRGSRGTEWHRTHLSDALGYMVHRLFPLGEEHDPSEDLPVGRLPRRMRLQSFL